MRAKPLLMMIATLAAIALIAVIGASSWQSVPPAVADDVVRPSIAPAAPALPARSTAAPRPASVPVPVPRAASVANDGLAARVDRWARSSDPADAMRAYEAVEQCLEARRNERRPTEVVAAERQAVEDAMPDDDKREKVRRSWKTAAAQCADLRSDQVENRMQWLARAAQAGEPSAALDFINEGADGMGMLEDLNTPRAQPTDAWMAQRDAYIDTALRHCDETLVAYLAVFARGDLNGVGEGYVFWQARAACDGARSDLPPLADDAVAMRYLRALNRPFVPK